MARRSMPGLAQSWEDSCSSGLVASPASAHTLLLVDPAENRLSAIADVATQADVRDETAARVLPDPAFGHREHVGYISRGEQAVPAGG
jgi:hypothetical protein